MPLISAILFDCAQFIETVGFLTSCVSIHQWLATTGFIFISVVIVFALNIVRAIKAHTKALTDSLLECQATLEQLVGDMRLSFSESERERLHRAANRNKFAVPPDVAEAIAKEWANLDHQAKIEPCPGAALNQHIHPLPEDPEPRKN